MPSGLRIAAKPTVKTLEDACAAMDAYAEEIERQRGPDFRAVHWFMKTVYNGQTYAGYGVPLALRAIADALPEDHRRSLGENQ